MFFNSEAYKKAFPETPKPAARPVENTCELYNGDDTGNTAPVPDEVNEPGEEPNDGDDADIQVDGSPDQITGEEV